MINVDELRRHAAMPEGQEKWSGQNLNMIFSLTQIQLWHDIFFDSQDYRTADAWRSCVS